MVQPHGQICSSPTLIHTYIYVKYFTWLFISRGSLLGGTGRGLRLPRLPRFAYAPSGPSTRPGCTFLIEVRMRKLHNYDGVHSMERPPGQQCRAVVALAPPTRQAARGPRALRSRRMHETARIALLRGFDAAAPDAGSHKTEAPRLRRKAVGCSPKLACSAAACPRLPEFALLLRHAFPPCRSARACQPEGPISALETRNAA